MSCAIAVFDGELRTPDLLARFFRHLPSGHKKRPRNNRTENVGIVALSQSGRSVASVVGQSLHNRASFLAYVFRVLVPVLQIVKTF